VEYENMICVEGDKNFIPLTSLPPLSPVLHKSGRQRVIKKQYWKKEGVDDDSDADISEKNKQEQ
jgi:hypothetical protein